MRQKHRSLRRLFLLIDITSIIVPVILFSSTSYILTSTTMVDEISHANLDTLIQLGQHMETIFTDIHDTSLFIFQQPELLSLYQMKPACGNTYDSLHSSMEYTMLQMCTSKSYLSAIEIELMNGVRLSCRTDGLNDNGFQTFPSADQSRLKLENGQAVWQFEPMGRDRGRITCSRFLKNMKNQVSGIGYMRLIVQEDKLRDLYNRISNLGISHVYLLDSQNRIISTNDARYYGKSSAEAGLSPQKLSSSAYSRMVVNGKSSLVTCYQIEGIRWRLVGVVPVRQLLRDNGLIIAIAVSGALLGLLVGIAVAIALRRMIFDRLAGLENSIKTLDGEDFSRKAPITGSDDEIDSLAGSFNQMSDRIHQVMDELYYSKIEQQKAELNMIHAQINPHFLYNALDTIYWQCTIEHAPAASKLVLALSKMFRMSLEVGNGKCLFREELECVKSYLQIHPASRSGRIRFTFDVERGLESLPVLKMLLQPLCENILKHAYIKKAQGGTAVVRVRREGNDLVYHVEDDGDGANEELVLSLMRNTADERGFALRNINNRLVLTYGPSYGLAFQSTPGVGTIVIIRQPIAL